MARMVTDAPTGVEAPGDVDPALTGMDAAPTDMAPSAWAAGAAAAAAEESAADGAQSATYRALAWSQDASADSEPVPYTDEDDSGGYDLDPAGGGAAVEFEAADLQRLPWYKRSAVLFSLAAAAAAVALLAAGLLAFKLRASNRGTLRPPPMSPSRANRPPPSQRR